MFAIPLRDFRGLSSILDFRFWNCWMLVVWSCTRSRYLCRGSAFHSVCLISEYEQKGGSCGNIIDPVAFCGRRIISVQLLTMLNVLCDLSCHSCVDKVEIQGELYSPFFAVFHFRGVIGILLEQF